MFLRRLLQWSTTKFSTQIFFLNNELIFYQSVSTKGTVQIWVTCVTVNVQECNLSLLSLNTFQSNFQQYWTWLLITKYTITNIINYRENVFILWVLNNRWAIIIQAFNTAHPCARREHNIITQGSFPAINRNLR